MPGPSVLVVVVLGCLLAPIGWALADQPDGLAGSVRLSQAKNATIGLIGGGPGSTDARIASDIARVVSDGDKLRVLPMAGIGSVQNIADLIYLKGVDLAIVHTDVLAWTMQQSGIPREGSVRYIAPLFPEEVHVLARAEIAGLKDLDGKPVAIGRVGSGTALTAAALLDMYHVSANVTHDGPSRALDRLRGGEIAAMFVVGGEPVPLLREIEAGTGLHFVPVPLNVRLLDSYLPGTLDHVAYPNLVPAGAPVDTVAVGSVLVTLDAPTDTARARRVDRFVDMLFARFDQFRTAGFHPKWRAVNLSAQVEGWTRYPEARDLLLHPGDVRLRPSFDSYLDRSGRSVSGMSNQGREALFRDFQRWRDRRGLP